MLLLGVDIKKLGWVFGGYTPHLLGEVWREVTFGEFLHAKFHPISAT